MRELIVLLLIQVVLVSCKVESEYRASILSHRQVYQVIHRRLTPPSMCGDYRQSQVQEPEELLPAGLNPVQAHDKLCSNSGIVINPTLRHVFNNFDASDSSVRHYDHVAPLDGITIGMGHWPQNEVSKFFEDIEKYPGVKKRFSKNCRGNDRRGYCRQAKPNMWKQLPWLPGILKRGLRDKVVTNWQTDFYYRDVINKGERGGGCNRRIRTRQKQFYCLYAKDMWDHHWPDAPTGKSSCRPIRKEITESTCKKFEPVKPSPCGDFQIQEHD